MAATRVDKYDVAKGICIILMIIGHSAFFFENSNTDFFISAIYTFHMPMFFFITGIFIKPYKKYSFKKESKRLLLPYVTTSIFILLITFIKESNNIDSWILTKLIPAIWGNGGNFFGLEISSNTTLWFLFCLFWGRLYYILLINSRKEFKAIIIVTTMSLIGFYFHSTNLPFCIVQALPTVCFIYAGQKIEQALLNKSSIFIILIIWLTYCCFYTLNICTCTYPLYYLSILSGVCGCILCTYISSIISKTPLLRKVKNILCFCGKNSMLLLCFNAMEVVVIPWYKIINLSTNSFTDLLIIIFHIIFVCLIVKISLHFKITKSIYC